MALFNFSLYLSMPRGILHIYTNELSSFGLTTHLLVFTSRKTSNRLIISLSPLEITDESIIGTHHSIQRVWKRKLLLKFYFLCSSISICFLNCCLQFRKVKGETNKNNFWEIAFYFFKFIAGWVLLNRLKGKLNVVKTAWF